MSDEKPWDWGTWRCTACGEEMLGERAEPPLDHVHSCEDATGDSLEFIEEEDDSSGQVKQTETCDLCGDDAYVLQSITSEPGLPSGMQSRIGICSGCHDALDAVDSEDCGWCGAGNASPVTVVGSSTGRYTLGWLCLECLDTENA